MVSLLTAMRDGGYSVVDIRQEDEIDVAEHCAQADIAKIPLGDYLGNFNGTGKPSRARSATLVARKLNDSVAGFWRLLSPTCSDPTKTQAVRRADEG